jgi:hypothetical protein
MEADSDTTSRLSSEVSNTRSCHLLSKTQWTAQEQLESGIYGLTQSASSKVKTATSTMRLRIWRRSLVAHTACSLQAEQLISMTAFWDAVPRADISLSDDPKNSHTTFASRSIISTGMSSREHSTSVAGFSRNVHSHVERSISPIVKRTLNAATAFGVRRWLRCTGRYDKAYALTLR